LFVGLVGGLDGGFVECCLVFACLFGVVVVVVVVVSPWFSMFRSRRRHHILLVAVYPHCLNMRHGTSYAPTISQSRHLRLVGSSARFFDTFVEQFLIQKAAPI
jgi:hypothetical protein